MNLDSTCKHGKKLRNCSRCLKEESPAWIDQTKQSHLENGLLMMGYVEKENLHYFGFTRAHTQQILQTTPPNFPEEIKHQGGTYALAVSELAPFQVIWSKTIEDPGWLEIFRVPYLKK